LRYKIGVYGSNRAEPAEVVRLAQQPGVELAKRSVIIITGACSGVPYAAASAGKSEGAEIWGFSSEHDLQGQQKAYPHDDSSIYDKLLYVPQDYEKLFFLENKLPPSRGWSARLKYRNVVSTVHADAGIIAAGGWGTMNEFTNLIYDGKPVGVLTGTGSLADVLPNWFTTLRKKSASKVFFSNDPHELVSSLLNVLTASRP
jgi:predicted Rossmann-fold nucleotide-binding protein